MSYQKSLRANALAIFILLALAALPAYGASTLFGNASETSEYITLVSQNSADPDVFSAGVLFDDLNGNTVSSLTALGTDYNVTDDDCAGGSPRFQIRVDMNGDGLNTSADKNIFIYIGPSPSFSGCTQNTWVGTGNLLSSPDPRFDTSQIGGTFYDTWANALSLVGTKNILKISLVIDSSWAFGDGEQTVLVDNIVVNGTTYDFTIPPANLNSSLVRISVSNQGSIENTTSAKSYTGGNTADGSYGGRGGRGGDISASFPEDEDGNSCPLPDTLGDVVVEVVNPAQAGEDDLQEILDNEGYGVDVMADQRQYQVWNTGGGISVTINAKYIANQAGYSSVFGYYTDGNIGNFTPVFKTGSIAGYGATPLASAGPFTINTGPVNTVAFAIKVFDYGGNPAGTFATQNSENSLGADQVVAYNPAINTYALGFEDKVLPISDADYNDLVVELILSCGAVGGNFNNGGASTGDGGDGGDAGTGGTVVTGDASALASTGNDSGSADIEVSPIGELNSSELGLKVDNDPGCKCPNEINNNTRARARSGGNSANGSYGGDGSQGGDINTPSGDFNNGGAGTGEGGDGGSGDEGGLVRAGNVVSNSQTLNLLNNVIIRLR